jgi:hypothetical protein
MTKVDQELLDEIARLEVAAILEGLQGEDRTNPAFLEKVRKFLVQNKMVTQSPTPGVTALKKRVDEIPDFDFN